MAHGGGQIYHAKTGVLYASGNDEVMRSTDDGVTWTKVGSGLVRFTTSVFGDGKHLYAHQAYGGSSAPFYVSPESHGVTWTPYTSGGSFDNSPFETVFDATNGILYAASWGEGMLALRVTP
jgi:hypothetical protein